MTLDEFHELTRTRFPTAAEFLMFAEHCGWRVVMGEDGRPRLRVGNGRDPLAIQFAKLLSREPYRTNVLAIAGVPAQAAPAPDVPPLPAPEVAGEPTPHHGVTSERTYLCSLCHRRFWAPLDEIRERLQSHVFCDRVGSLAVTSRRTGELISPEQPRCPFKD